MNDNNVKGSLTALALLAAAFVTTQTVQAHCDSLDGPVVNAARAALTESNVNLVLIWVQKDDAVAIKHAFEMTLAVRKLNAEARELADRYYTHYVKGIHDATAPATHGHFPETAATPPAAHPHKE